VKTTETWVITRAETTTENFSTKSNRNNISHSSNSRGNNCKNSSNNDINSDNSGKNSSNISISRVPANAVCVSCKNRFMYEYLFQPNIRIWGIKRAPLSKVKVNISTSDRMIIYSNIYWHLNRSTCSSQIWGSEEVRPHVSVFVSNSHVSSAGCIVFLH